MAWDSYFSTVMQPKENGETWNLISEADLLIGGVDYTIDYLSVNFPCTDVFLANQINIGGKIEAIPGSRPRTTSSTSGAPKP